MHRKPFEWSLVSDQKRRKMTGSTPNSKEKTVKQTTHIDAANIQRLRLRCQHCRAEIVLPIDAKDAPSKCFNCHHEIPGTEAIDLVKKLHWLQQAAQNPIFNFDAAIEADSDDGI